MIEGRELGQFVTDFTWYLRNLMLVQSSDDMEDVLDISSAVSYTHLDVYKRQSLCRAAASNCNIKRTGFPAGSPSVFGAAEDLSLIHI